MERFSVRPTGISVCPHAAAPGPRSSSARSMAVAIRRARNAYSWGSGWTLNWEAVETFGKVMS